MHIYDFITEEEIEDLPEENEAAFLAFVKIARGRLTKATSSVDTSDEQGLTELYEARHGFMNVVTAAARRYGIEPFASMDVPRAGNFGSDEHRQFTADLDHYMTQLLLSDGLGKKRDSVALSGAAKTRIRTHIHHLREQLGKEEMPLEKREELLKSLANFEDALDKRRLSLLALTRITVEILAAPGALAGSYDIATKLLTNVFQTVAQEKGNESEQRIRVDRPTAILPVRPSEAFRQQKKSMESDDDIPF
ncbi:hypothetical protein [Ensifer sp. 4252]|uniref:hypothetical protein n=1 Tax=Ensifer sp. 4252 TaxID=3373915 RepID=UPI003D1F6AAE